MKITLDIKKSLEENAAVYFEKSKKARKKQEGVQRTLQRFEKQFAKEQAQQVEVVSQIKKLSSEKKYWFEKFKWFITSEGFLVVAGRDATTNEIIIKKHTQQGDVVFHTDMAGSPFVVIKKNKEDVARMIAQTGSLDIGEASLHEAASFTAIHSRAWKMGLSDAKVFWVNPDQVSKEAQAGEYMAKGSFMIRGKTNYVEPDMNFLIGVVKQDVAVDNEQFLLAGPRQAVTTYCKHAISVIQGNDKASDVAKRVRGFFKEFEEVDLSTDAIISTLPSGGCTLEKIRRRK